MIAVLGKGSPNGFLIIPGLVVDVNLGETPVGGGQAQRVCCPQVCLPPFIVSKEIGKLCELLMKDDRT